MPILDLFTLQNKYGTEFKQISNDPSSSFLGTADNGFDLPKFTSTSWFSFGLAELHQLLTQLATAIDNLPSVVFSSDIPSL